MRDQLLDLVRPLADKLAEDLADLLAERVDAMLVEVGHAIEVALSAATSALGDEIDKPKVAAPEPPAAPVARRARADRPRDVLPEPQPDGHSTDKRAKNGKAWPSCRLCGKRGVTARTHPAHVDQTPAEPPPPASAATPSRRDAIAAAQAARRAAPAPRQAARYMPPEQQGDDEPEPSETLDEAIARAEANKRDGELPVPRSSWQADSGGVRELDFGGQG